MQWTERQLAAIETRDKNILVAAAAGSGKTAVLVERILRLILDGQTNVDELLVVTFTKAAASEMKGKIIKAIKKEITENPEKAVILNKQLDNMYKTSISTFHAFAIDIIKKYFYIININPNMKIIDDEQGILLKNTAIDKVFEEKFEKNDKSFIDFLNKYSSHKNDNAIKENILDFYDRLQALPEPFIWLDGKVESLKDIDKDYTKSEIYKAVEDEIHEVIKESIAIKESIILELKGYDLDRLAESHEIDLSELYDITMALDKDDLNYAIKKISAFTPQTMTRAREKEKDIYNGIKDNIKDRNGLVKKNIKSIIEKYAVDSLEKQFQEVANTYNSALELKDILLDLHRKISDAKFDKNIMDFSDIEHFALEILKDENVANECKNKFKYIFIDEYQDSNFLQEAIIARVKRDNNLFMVGDIKQSIYSFRLAEPSIFKDKYELYKSGEDKNSIKIDLNQNFRSKEPIIDSINHIFEKIMNGYDEDAYLYLGAKSNGMDFKTELILIEADTKKILDNKDTAEIMEELDEKDEIKSLLKAEIETLAILEVIKTSLGQEYYDHKEDKVKTISYKDIVILMRSIKNWGSTVKEVLEKNNIPVYINDTEGYFETIEINLLLDLLKVVDNFKQDSSLIGVLKSPIFNFTTEELIKIRLLNKKGPFHKVFKSYITDGDDSLLQEKCNQTVEQFLKWRKESRYTPISDFIYKIIQDSGLYIYASTMVNGKQRQVNLRTFVDKATKYSKTGDSSIYGLIKYFEKIKNKNVKVGQSSLVSEEDDSIQITTIHKSKGLEYPIVIVPRLASSFRSDRADKIGLNDKKLGIALSYVDLEKKFKKETIAQKAIKYIKHSDYIEEELRVLYVAMTRAKDKLVLIGNQKDVEKYYNKNLGISTGKSSYLDYIFKALPANVVDIKLRVVSDYDNFITLDHDDEKFAIERQRVYDFKEDALKANFEDISPIMEYVYPYENELKVKSKYSVSELNKKDVYKKEIAFKHTNKKQKKKISGAALGTVYHTIMEHIDFAMVGKEGEAYIHSFLEELLAKEILTKEESEAVKADKILNFFNSEIGKRAVNSNPIKEKTFTMLYDVNGVETMVQGIIDCYFEEDGELVLVDYKTNYNTSNIDEIYKKQIELYSNALENGLGMKVKERWLYLFNKDEGLLIT